MRHCDTSLLWECRCRVRVGADPSRIIYFTQGGGSTMGGLEEVTWHRDYLG